MYKFLHRKDSGASAFVPDSVAFDTLTTDTIAKEFELDSWEIRVAPNHEERTQKPISNSNYFYRHDFNPPPPGQLTRHGRIINPYVKNKHTLVQFKEGLSWFKYFTEEGLVTIDSSIIMDESHFGVTCDMGLSKSVQGEDTVGRYFILCLGHTSGTPKMLGYTDIRPVCQNTLVAAAMSALGKSATSFNIEADPDKAFQKAKELIALTKARFELIDLPAYQHMTKIKVGDDERDLLFRKVLGMPLEGFEFSEKLQDRYEQLNAIYKSSPGMELFDANEHTGWRVLQAMTYAAKSMGGSSEANYLSRYRSRWASQTYEWLNLRFDKDVAPLKSPLSKEVTREIVAAL